MKTMREVSPHFGVSVSVGEPDGGCQYWPVRGPERFVGPWNATLEWPMLIVSNTVGGFDFPCVGLVIHIVIVLVCRWTRECDSSRR
jgi:hypothetical protein